MKTSSFIIFVSIVIVVYGLINYYIFYRGLQLVPSWNGWKTSYIISFWTLAACFFLARFLERVIPGIFVDILTWTGNFWLAAMLYFFLAIIFIDIVRLIFWIAHYSPGFMADIQQGKAIVLISVIGIVCVALLSGFINARIQRRTTLNLEIHKKVEGPKTLRIAMASDIHLGTMIGSRGAKKLVRKLNTIKPDIILLAGDVVDEDLQPVLRRNLGETLKDLSAPLGVYAITGNHEYIGGVEPAVKYLQEHGIKFIRDTTLFIDNRFYLAGREDRDISRFTNKKRKEIGSVLEGVDKSFPVIMMDHQPFDFQKVVEQGVDLQLSGHTHHGQIWPLNYITNAIYEVSWGYKRKENTHFYVSSGFGSWGPPVRLGNYPEVIEINLRFD